MILSYILTFISLLTIDSSLFDVASLTFFKALPILVSVIISGFTLLLLVVLGYIIVPCLSEAETMLALFVNLFLSIP